jgi:flagellar motility protein MotE (MotC chaperone)|tara:strand:- start:12296 stop:12571 length:276 start_codon:yes stop_codon:yes gene_type:complete
MSKPLNDELQIHISVKWAVQILFLVFTLTGAWYTLNANINNNEKDIRHIKESLIEFEKMLDERMEPLEAEREQRLEEMNKTLLGKILTKGD